MIKFLHKFHKTALLALVMLVLVMPVASAQAQVSYTNYSPTSQAEIIAYLQGIIAQLQAELAARQGNQVYSHNQYQYQYQYQPQPVGQVYGVTYPNTTYQVEAGTGFVSADRGEYTLFGTVDLNGAGYAYAWFEYGDDDDFGRTTSRKHITQDVRFSATVYPSRGDDYLYYRAVTESPNGHRDYGSTRAVFVRGNNNYNDNGNYNGNLPDVETDRADDIDDHSAELNGSVDMNDFRNGLVFFVYGEDENDVEDVDREDSYRDIDERGDDLQKFTVDSDLDGDDDYSRRITGLDDDTEYFFRICVEFEDDDDDERLVCGEVEDFETDR
jgi:hypothetical protein